MYQNITIEHSLFFINEQYITNFKKIAEKMQPFITIKNAGTLNLQDMWIETFNLWLLLHREEDNILEASTKTLTYSANYLLFHTLKNDYQINFFRSHTNTTSEHRFILSVILITQLSEWFNRFLSESNNQDILLRNQKRNYFLMHLQSKEQLQQFMNDQSRLVKLFVQHSKKSNELERLIKKCCDETRFLYQGLVKNQSYQTS